MARSLVFGLAAAACACLAVGTLVSTACITAPPPELPAEIEHRPTILHESLVPPAANVLPELPPQGFVVPILLEDPNEPFWWEVFVDYNPCTDPPNCTVATSPEPPGARYVAPTPGTLDGGVVPVSFTLPADVDPTQCHQISFFVAHGFSSTSPVTFDPIGGDSAVWNYWPEGVQCTQLVYDAGAFQDGAFPPADAAPDSLPVVPESGTD
ncbi:MAG: hypothetical protein ABSE49_17400 [Polyangiaceae bacterium]|jgi:hypothetical protein